MKHGNIIIVLFAMIAIAMCIGCVEEAPIPPATSDSGVTKASQQLKPIIAVDGEMVTVEQSLIKKRLKLDNRPGQTKNLYILGSNGQIVLHQIIEYKVVSSGKRLTPRTVSDGPSAGYGSYGIDIQLGGQIYTTGEVLEDDGTYGDSNAYFYAFTTAGNFVKYIPMGQFLAVESDMPLTPQELTFMVEAR